jgi:sporulation protein YlmC with PRC-barrel domain
MDEGARSGARVGKSRPFAGALLLAIAVSAIMGVTIAIGAEAPGKIDLQAAEMTADLIGAPVYSTDGSAVGEVADIFFNEENEPTGLKMKAAAHLGLGARIINVPKGAFIVLRGAVVLEMPAGAVPALPELSEPSDDH